MSNLKRVALCKIKSAKNKLVPVFDARDLIKSRAGSHNSYYIQNPQAAADVEWEDLAVQRQKILGNNFTVNLKKFGVCKSSGLNLYKIMEKPVKRFKKLVFYVPQVRGKTKGSKSKYKNAEYLHKYGMYVGLHQKVKENQLINLINFLNSL